MHFSQCCHSNERCWRGKSRASPSSKVVRLLFNIIVNVVWQVQHYWRTILDKWYTEPKVYDFIIKQCHFKSFHLLSNSDFYNGFPSCVSGRNQNGGEGGGFNQRAPMGGLVPEWVMWIRMRLDRQQSASSPRLLLIHVYFTHQGLSCPSLIYRLRKTKTAFPQAKTLAMVNYLAPQHAQCECLHTHTRHSFPNTCIPSSISPSHTHHFHIHPYICSNMMLFDSCDYMQ